jgi:hypothetical protein
MSAGRSLLLAAGWMSVVASLLHIAVIFGGAGWYRFFGAGERMARAAERGAIAPTIITLIIATVLATWAAFAFGAAGSGPRLPFTRIALIAIAAVLLVRAAAAFIPAVWSAEHSSAFIIWSSAICLIMGGCFALGTWQAWPQLSLTRNIP